MENILEQTISKQQVDHEDAVKGCRICKDYINSLPILRFNGRISVIDNEDKLREICDQLSTESLLGFDTESRPAFRKGVSYPVSLVQLATDQHAYIIQLKKTGFIQALVDIFEDQKIAKIGVGLTDDIKKLKQQVDFQHQKFIELSDIASSKGIIQTGLRALTARYLNHRISKSAQKTNWAMDTLTEKQLVYAATDAWISLKLYQPVLSDCNHYHEEVEEEETESSN